MEDPHVPAEHNFGRTVSAVKSGVDYFVSEVLAPAGWSSGG